ncbi:MAG: polysaccharide deacetylase family protein [Pyrinomonadaceae bacterium]
MSKRFLQKTLNSRYLTPLWVPLSRDRISIFTLHRFAAPEQRVSGHDRAVLRQTLAQLRRGQYNILSLDEAVRRLRERLGFPPRSLVFTVDDGYFDFAEVGAKVFSDFDCPVTVFLTTGFLEGTHWHWWDKIDHVIRQTSARRLSLAFKGQELTIQLDDSAANRPTIAGRVALDCTTVSESERADFIDALATAADVEIPARPPARYAPMKWDDARHLERQGVSFGPHTMSHPILIQATDEDAAWQIGESWRLLRQRIARPLPILAYPNGDYGSRELELVARTGLAAAVTTEQTYAHTERFHSSDHGNLTIPRFAYPDHPDNLCLTAAGFTRLSAAVRRALPFLP